MSEEERQAKLQEMIDTGEKAEPYELTLMVRPDISLKELDVLHDIIMKHFEDGDGWKRWENNGIKKLAYEIKGETYAGYFWVEGCLKHSKAVELARELGTEPHMLRYLLIKQVKPKGV